MEITSIDKVGRVVLPKETRKRLGITEKTKFLVAEVKEDTIVLKKIDVETMAKRLEADLKDVDLTALFRKVRDETNEKSDERTQKFLLDTNVFVSALQSPGKTLELFVEMLGKKYDLVGNVYLLDELSQILRKVAF